jgi:hypothetical protein
VRVRERSSSGLGDDTFDMVTARLEKLAENAERALAVPRQTQLERQLRHCEDVVNRIKDVVLNLCEYMKITPDGLGPSPLHPPAAVLSAIHHLSTDIVYPRYEERGVGPDDEDPPQPSTPMSNAGEADGIYELEVEMAATPPSPTGGAGDTSDAHPTVSSSPSPAPSDAPAINLSSPAQPAAVSSNLKPLPPLISLIRCPTPPAPLPNVNLIPPTPQTSENTVAAAPMSLDSPASIFGPVHSPTDIEAMPGSQAQRRQETPPPTVAVPPAAVSSDTSSDNTLPPQPEALPPPLPPLSLPVLRSRSHSPLPPSQHTLAIPLACGMMTRSRSRSPSPGAATGSKRKNDQSGDESDRKKRRV